VLAGGGGGGGGGGGDNHLGRGGRKHERVSSISTSIDPLYRKIGSGREKRTFKTVSTSKDSHTSHMNRFVGENICGSQENQIRLEEFYTSKLEAYIEGRRFWEEGGDNYKGMMIGRKRV